METFSSFTAPSHWCRSRPYSFVSVFSFFLPYPGTWGVSCLLGGLRSSASVLYVFCKSCSTRRCTSDVFVGRKVISTSYSSTILKLLQVVLTGTRWPHLVSHQRDLRHQPPCFSILSLSYLLKQLARGPNDCRGFGWWGPSRVVG